MLEFSRLPIPAEFLAEAESQRHELWEQVAEHDDQLCEDYLEGRELPAEQVKKVIRRMTIEHGYVPVFCGSGLKNKGIQPLLDAIIDFLPAPDDVPPVSGINPLTQEQESRPAAPREPLTALLYKVAMIEGRRLSYLRIYAGGISPGQDLYNPRLKSSEKVARLFQMQAHKKIRIKEAGPGEIVAIMGLKRSVTGDTLCAAEHPLLLEGMEFTRPVISAAIEPKLNSDQDKLWDVLLKISDEDPTFAVKIDDETGQMLISGMGELHLEIIKERLVTEYNLETNLGKPQVLYQESITASATESAQFERIDEDEKEKQFAKITVTVAPRERESGNIITIADDIKNLSERLLEAVNEGVKESLNVGVVHGYSLVDVSVHIETIEGESSDFTKVALKIAAANAVRQALQKAHPVLLEPTMSVDIVVPPEHVGEIIGDLNARGGKVNTIKPQDFYTTINALAPLRSLFGYTTTLRSATKGKGSFTMKFFGYDQSNAK